MPPKKQEQQNQASYLPFYVLPLFMQNSSQQSEAYKILKSKPINIKKCIDKAKSIQLLKQKGLSQYLTPQGQLKQEGRKFICQNIKTVMQDFIVQLTKPSDPKKDAGKKDAKKDTKKQQVPADEQKNPLIQLAFQKKCNDFHFYLDLPSNIEEIKTCIQSGMIIDAIVVIEDKVKKGSTLPDYNLLGKTYESSQLLEHMNKTKINDNDKRKHSAKQLSSAKLNNQILKYMRRIKNQKPQFSNMLITQIPFEKNIGSPENNQWNFINGMFTKLCQTTIEKENYQKWVKNEVKRVPMIEPLKEIIKKQIPIQSQDKKGKKDANKQPEFQTVEEIIQTKYQSLAQNIKSDLKIYNHINSFKNTNNSAQDIKQLLNNCLLSIDLQLDKNSDKSRKQHEYNPESLILKKTSKPVAKLNHIDSLKQNLRKVQYLSKNSLQYNLIFPSKEIDLPVSLTQILYKNPRQKELYQFQYIIKAMTDFMLNEEPKLRLNFSDRTYRQKLTKSQVLSQIQSQLLKDLKIYQSVLKKDNIKLLCLAKINPPGRMLYSNDLFSNKVAPNFENWLHFKSQNLGQKQFYDYKFEDAGNLSIRRQKLTPTDNVVICDEKITIGNSIMKVNHLEKLNTCYGLKSLDSGLNQFWLSNQKDAISLSIFQKEHEFKKTSVITQNTIKEGSDQEKVEQKLIQSIEKQKRIETWFRTQNFILSHTPYPAIYWLNRNTPTRLTQLRRQFGPKGQITTYLADGTIKIFYRNGNISTFRNNQWQRIVNHEVMTSNCPARKLNIHELTEGDKTIRIRQDQTSFVQYSNGNSLIIFSDNTKILYKKNSNSYQIKNFNPQVKQEIIVRISLPRTRDFNIIGHGSAFAYLGFKNLTQRSYDGFIYEVWHNKFSTHLYNEKYEHQNHTYEEQIRLICLNDGSLIKVQGTDHVTYIQGDYEHNEQSLRHKWNQAFSLKENHQVGVYDVDLAEGYIKTKDSESNYFKINVEDENQINIAVSFKISEDDKIQNKFGNGFHVPEENYFLPVPEDSLPARIFSFDQETQSYYEYLSNEQIKLMQSPASEYHIDEFSSQSKTVKQYTRRKVHSEKFKEQSKLITFSSVPSENDFVIPSVLLPKQTRISMPIQNDPIEFRMIQRIEWNIDFQNVKRLENEIISFKQSRKKALQFVKAN